MKALSLQSHRSRLLATPRLSVLSAVVVVLFVTAVGYTVVRSSRAATLVGDLNGDGVVNIFDLSILLSDWGTNNATADLNHDGTVNIFDLSTLLSNWGSTAPSPSLSPSPSPSTGASCSRTVAPFCWPTSVSSNHRYLLDQNGNPYFFLANQLLPGLRNGSLSDINTVLTSNQIHSFNGLWLSLIDDSYIGADDSLTDYNNNLPFTGTAPNLNISSPVAAYWSNVDSVVSSASSKGITVMMCPVETAGNAMNVLRNTGNAGSYAYGQFLGNRYKNDPNIFWYIGNDFGGGSSWVGGPPSQSDDTLMENVFAGIRSTGDTHLSTVELDYPSSLGSDDSSAGGWRSIIDLNQAYTYTETYDMVLKGYLGINSDDSINQTQRYTPKPVLMGESNYEGADNINGTNPATPYTLRLQNYWTMLAGGLAGQVWGNKPVHHFLTGWQNDLNTPGTIEAGIWATFFQSINYQNLVPDIGHTFVTSGYGTYAGQTVTDSISGQGATPPSTLYSTAALSADGSLGVVYMPVSRSFTMDMSKFRGSVTVRWFDPTTGAYSSITGSPFANSGIHTFSVPPAHNDGADDWVLILTS